MRNFQWFCILFTYTFIPFVAECNINEDRLPCDTAQVLSKIGGFENHYAINYEGIDDVFLNFKDCLESSSDQTWREFYCDLGIAYLLEQDSFDKAEFLALEKLAITHADYYSLAKLYYTKTRLGGAAIVGDHLELFKKAFRYIQKTEKRNSYLAARLQHNIGNMMCQNGLEDWMPYFKRSIELKETIGLRSKASFSAQILALRCSEKGSEKECFDAIAQSRELLVNSTDTANLINLHNNIADAIQILGYHTDEVYEAYDAAIELCSHNNPKFCYLCSQVYASRLIDAAAWFDLPVAEEMLLLYGKLYNDLPILGQAKYFKFHGDIAILKGQNREALEYARIADGLLNADPFYNELDRNYYVGLDMKIQAFDRLAMLDSAKYYSDVLIERFQKSSNRSGLQQVFANLITTYINNQAFQEASDLMKENDVLIAKDYFYFRSKAHIHSQLGEYDEAIKFYKLSENKAADPVSKAKMLVYSGISKGNLGDQQGAMDEFRKGISLLKSSVEQPDSQDLCRLNDVYDLLLANLAIGSIDLYEKSGNLKWVDSANYYLEDYEFQIKFIQNYEYDSDLIFSNWQTSLELKKDLNYSLWKSDPESEALKFDVFKSIEEGRYNVLAQKAAKSKMLRNDNEVSGLTLKYNELIAKQNQLINLAFNGSDKKVTSDIEKNLQALNEIRVEMQESGETLVFPEYEYDLLGLDELQKTLDNKNLDLITFSFLDDTLFCFQVQNSSLSVTNCEISKVELAQLLEDFKKELELQNGSISENLLLKLGLIIPENVCVFSQKPLLIIPGELLAELPFESFLIKSKNETKYLGIQRDVLYAFSLRFLSTEPKSDFQNDFVAFSPFAMKNEVSSDFEVANKSPFYRGLNNDELTPINSEREMVTARSMYDVKEYTGVTATEENLKNEGDSRILYLASHGIGSNGEDFIGLSLMAPKVDCQKSAGRNDRTINFCANDGFLHAYEAYDLNLKTDLTILGACETGVGDYRAGEGVMSLARSFRASGSESILTSLWKVDDASTSEIFSQYFKNLGEGQGKATALANAKRTFIKDHPTASPAYWAGFVLIGNNNPVAGSVSNYSWLWAILACLSLVGVLVFIRKKKVSQT